MNRAYALIETKAVDADQRVIEGIASTPTVDRMGDVVDPMGATFRLPLSLLWQHRHDEPVGHVEWAKATAEGIRFRARFVKVEDPGQLRDRLETAWQSVRSGLVRAVSIGFRPIESEPIKSGYRYKRWEWHELSCVTIPAQADATIENVKFFDEQMRATRGAIGKVRPRLIGSVADAYADAVDEFAERTKAAGWAPSSPGSAPIDQLAEAAVAAALQTDAMLKALHDRITAMEASNGAA